MLEPELITVIEGPTPEFRPSPLLWLQSIYEGQYGQNIGVCELRTGNGESIMARCRHAWDEKRLVKLDYPDHLRLRQQADVVAMRLNETDDGMVLLLWVCQPVTEEEEEEFDDGHDDLYY